MKSILIASALLVASAVAQQDFKLPGNAVAKARVADLLNSPSVEIQWRFGGFESKYAWDGPSGCFQESWLN